MIRAGVHFLLAIRGDCVGLYGALGYHNWLVGQRAERGAILVFGFMGAAVMGLALIYNEIVAEIHNE